MKKISIEVRNENPLICKMDLFQKKKKVELIHHASTVASVLSINILDMN